MRQEIEFDRFFTAIRSVLSGPEPFSLHEPEFRGDEWAFVKDCIDSGWVSSAGSYVDRFERELEDFTGIDHAVATVNGTAALHACLMLSDVEPGDEVLVQALTFVATANAVSYCHAVPHFVDVDERSLSVDPDKLADYLDDIGGLRNGNCVNRHTGRVIRALIVMHTFGHPAELDALSAICEQRGITLIEDAAEALGSRYQDKHVGLWGKVTALSFNGNKIVTTGGGGAVLTSQSKLAETARHLTTTAKRPHQWAFFHDRVGYNYRMPNLNAALGCAQMGAIGDFLNRKRKLASRYIEAFKENSLGRMYVEPPGARSNYWLNCFRLDEPDVGVRDELLSACHARGILARPSWELMPQLPMYSDSPRMDLATAKRLQQSLICLPSSPALEIQA